MASQFRLMSYNPQWPQEFEQSRSSILQAAQGWIVDVQHCGSTALRESIARPVVDMVAGLSDLQQLNPVCSLLEGLNYRRVEVPPWCEEELCGMLIKPRSSDPTHSVLVVTEQGTLWQRAIAMRNFLSNHPEDWANFKQLKLDYFQPGCSAELNYESAKSQFFATLEEKMNGG